MYIKIIVYGPYTAPVLSMDSKLYDNSYKNCKTWKPQACCAFHFEILILSKL